MTSQNLSHLGAELRDIAASPTVPTAYRDRLRMLAAEVTAAATVPDAIHTPLQPDQEIRARAIELAADLLDLPRETTVAHAYDLLTTLAKPIAAYIRDGRQPTTEGETR